VTRATSYGAAIAGALVLIGLGYWFATNFARVSRSILPGMAASPSQSMEPYELVFKLDTSPFGSEDNGEASRPPVMWRLTVPRAFLWSEIGSNEDVGGGVDHQLHTASLYAMFEPGAGTFSPAVFSDPSTADTDAFFFNPANAGGGKLSRTDKCVRQDDLDAFIGKKAGRYDKCNNDSPARRCGVSMNFKGWSVRILMPKKYYFGDYQKYCDAAHDFLDDHTIAAADIRDLARD